MNSRFNPFASYYVVNVTLLQAFIITRNNKQEYPNAIQAAEETSGKILTYKGTILLDCPYGAGNGGRTKAYKNYPYLIEQDDPWDKAETAIMLSKNQKVRRGNGYGMSQYGARYAANNGVGNEKILGFYYPTADITTIENYAVDTPTEEVNALPLSTKEQAIKEWALSQVGYGYVWGATGQILTRSVLEQLIARHGTNVKMPTAEKWIGKKVFDCASLVAEASRQILNLKMVSGASSQWKGNYWESKGTIDT